MSAVQHLSRFGDCLHYRRQSLKSEIFRYPLPETVSVFGNVKNSLTNNSKNSMGHVLMLVGFIDTLICKKFLGFKLSTYQKGLMRWQNCYGFLT